MTERRRPEDWRERLRALDITRSFIVQAPAGSGKTELLVQRLLALLAVAETPEEVLAITFTRKAAGEMRLRLLEALERACDDTPPEQPYAMETWQRSRAVLARDREQGWRLLQNPSRLQMLTIDGFCSMLTKRMPWMARFGDQPQVTEQPEELYRLAAESLLERVETGGDSQEAIAALLDHLDNRLTLLRDLVMAMLGRRDQWLRHLMAKREEQARRVLESGLQRFVYAALQRAYGLVGADLYQELWDLAAYAGANLRETQPDHLLVTLVGDRPEPTSFGQWQAIAQLVLTNADEVRKSVTKTIGFPADRDPKAVAAKARMLDRLEMVAAHADMVDALRALRQLPDLVYHEEQWRVLEALIELLPLAVLALKDVFRQQGQVDFVEVAGAAHAALGTPSAPEELLLQLDSRFRHILVDEFQDTSYAQYGLLALLTSGWEEGDGRTLFLVGDPMQSIYRFREAEVGLYLRVAERGLASLQPERVVLTTNFRSVRPLVNWTNTTFHGIFPPSGDDVVGAVPFAPAEAFEASTGLAPVSLTCYASRQDEVEAKQVVALVEQARAAQPDVTIAVLVRSRSHLAAIVPALKRAGLRFPAQDVDSLADRPVVQDLLALIRALSHQADRVAWLAVLRAPWCGLSLADLVALCEGAPRRTVWQLLTEPAAQIGLFDDVSADGRERLRRVVPVLARALQRRGQLSVRQLVESTWLSLGGPACVDEAGLLDARQVFRTLEELGAVTDLTQLEQRLKLLFAAPDPLAGPELQLMTIHKAKGLEFDTVILPGLGRGVRAGERTLLRWLEHPDYELLLAPIPAATGDGEDATYRALGAIHKAKDDHETVRLLYVAATRARSRLHLLGHAALNADGEARPTPGSFLATLWPRCGEAASAALITGDVQNSPRRIVTLKRLPNGWQIPPLPASVTGGLATIRPASMTAHYREESQPTRRTEEGRVVGTLVHQWLERIAEEGLAHWLNRPFDRYRDRIRQQLCLAGVPRGRLEPCAALVLACLENTLRSERGRWLLAAHEEAASEFALNGVVEGQLVRATIDRTFVDEEGTRWVVDYKTAAPADNEPQSAFLDREAERYGPQLASYAALVQQLAGQGRVRAALYFPLFDGWREMAGL